MAGFLRWKIVARATGAGLVEEPLSRMSSDAGTEPNLDNPSTTNIKSWQLDKDLVPLSDQVRRSLFQTYSSPGGLAILPTTPIR